MNCRLLFKIFPVLLFLALPVPGRAQAEKTLLITKIAFGPDGAAKVGYDTKGNAAQEVESSKIQSALVFYALAMNRLDAESGKALLNQVQAAVGKIATEQGLVRADLLKGNPLLKALQAAPAEQTLDLTFSQVGKSNAVELKPETVDPKFLAPAVLYLFQDQVKTLSESGVRLMVLAMGGMNKWYREVGKASDADSVAKAPAYALNLAVDILEKLGGKKKPN